MTAVIMAGGEGKRLRPLTCDLPKPMARLLGRPALEYAMDLLLANGIKQAAVALGYLPEKITGHFPDNAYGELKLSFIEEDGALGTAGGVKNACKLCGTAGDVLVLSGGAICDFDLKELVAFHKKTGADLTVAAKRVADPREHGLIVADESGAVTGFVEKPAYSQAVSDLADTGVYVVSPGALGLIPDGAAFDFGRDLFPLLLEKGKKLMCMECDGYWCDLSDIASYLSCQRDMLNGLVRCRIKGQRDSDGNVLAGGVPPGWEITGKNCYIGSGVKIEEGARIEGCCVLDDGAVVERGARVADSVLLNNSYVARRARLTGALLCSGASVKAGAVMCEGSALGAGAVLGEKANLSPGVGVWNKKTVPDGAAVTEHIRTGSPGGRYFDEDGITGQMGVELTPEFAARLGAAAGSLNPGARVAIGCGGHRSADMLKAALGAGIRSTGSAAVDFGENFGAMFEYCMNFCSLNTGVFITGGSKSGIRVLGPGGLPAGRETERKIEAALGTGDFSRCSPDSTGDLVEMGGISAMYISQLLRFAPGGLSGLSVQIRSSGHAARKTLADALNKLGCSDDGGFTIELSAQGDKLRVYDGGCGYIPHHKIFAWCAIARMRRERSLAVPFDAPRVLDEYALKNGVKLLRYMSCPADSSDNAARSLAKSQMWSRDALMQAVIFLDMVKRAGSLAALLEQAPRFDRETRTVSVAAGGSPAAMMRGIGGVSGNKDPGERGKVPEGVLWVGEKGTVWLTPLKRGTGIRILAEALSWETAAELCDDMEKRLKQS